MNASSGLSWQLFTLQSIMQSAQITHYQPFKEELNFEGIDFPVSIDQIGKFEKQNPRMSVTVIGMEEEKTKKHKGKKSNRAVSYH